MPNWCDNYLTLTGSQEDLQAFVVDNLSVSKDDEVIPFSFNALVPFPASKEENNYLDWATENWGTKWDLSSNDGAAWHFIDDTHATITFSTAWSPPTAWLKTAASFYPNIDFSLEYVEAGVEIYGKTTVKNGIFEDTDLSAYYNELSEFFLDTIKKLSFDNDDISEVLAQATEVISATKYAYVYDALGGHDYFYEEIEEVFH